MAGARHPGGLIAYFGYGSLVCRATHRTGIVDAVPARLRGWRRHWRARPDMPGFPAALLSVRREKGAGCDGLLVIDHADNLAAVDAREARYNRVELSPDALDSRFPLPRDCPIYLYVADEAAPRHPEPPLILRSYLDAVLSGFLAEHGEEGLRRFVTETAGFEIGIREDRPAPIYPRAVKIDTARSRLFDAVLRACGAIAG